MDHIPSQAASAEQISQIYKSSSLFLRSSCVPASLIAAAPQCATSCIENFVQDNYGSSTCQERSDLEFLCTHSNGAGLTIGEAGLQCVFSDCTGIDSQDVGVYAICADIAGAIPETAGTITATVNPMAAASSTSTTLPSNIGNPSSTESVASIVSATGTPSIPSTTTASSSTPLVSVAITSTLAETTLSSSLSTPSHISSFQSDPQATSTSVAAPATTQVHSQLSTAQIVGIAVAGVASASFAFALLLCVYCLRKKRRRKRRSQRWSIEGEKPPPDSLGDSQLAPNPGSTPSNAAPATFNLNHRYYASAPVEEKRRSFWRKSIKPEEIGVAFSPEVKQEASPSSVSSQKTVSRLLLAAPPMPSLWPAPLKIEGPKRRDPPTKLDDAANLDDVSGRDMSRAPGFPEPTRANDFSGRGPTKRQRVAPLVLGDALSKTQPTKALADQGNMKTPKSSRIPLTPIYDNGNFTNGLHQPYLPFPQPPANPGGIYHPHISKPGPQNEYRPLPARGPKMNHQLNRSFPPQTNNVGKISKPPPSASAYYQYQNSGERKASAHKSIASDTTEFEEDSTPEQETDNQLGITSRSSSSLQPLQTSVCLPEVQERSPINDLTYPRIPRPAAVSKQAERPPRPLGPPRLESTGPSYMVPTIGNSSHSRNLRPQGPSQREIADAWSRYPTFVQSSSTPSTSLAARRGNPLTPTRESGGLRISTAPNHNAMNWAQNTGVQTGGPDVFSDRPLPGSHENHNTLYKEVAYLSPDSPPLLPQARLTPNRTVDGDLFLTVD